MEFKTNHLDLSQYAMSKKNRGAIKLPEDRDIFFRAKQNELVDQYTAARFFLSQACGENYKTWHKPVDNENGNSGIQNTWRSYFYEAALMYYNILVDLSWVLTYVSVEDFAFKGSNAIQFDKIKPINDAMELMRSVEEGVVDPTVESNPIMYIKKMYPRYDRAIEMVIDFWKKYKESSIRNMYNYCKHRGKPNYEEIAMSKGPKIARFNRPMDDGSMTRVAFDTREVRYTVSLEKSIEELFAFDDEELFPYLRSLIEELEKIVQPSPMIF